MSEAKPRSTGPSPGSWAALVALGTAAALWSLFLWGELLVARSGGTPFCGAVGGGCAALWDAPFAMAVHRLTGVPVAGWGLAWAVTALGLPLVALWRAAEGRPLPVLVSATRFVAGGGVGGVLVLAAVSASERTFCIGCIGFYGLVAAYGGIALFGWTDAGLPEGTRGAALAAGAVALAFVLLLAPGQRTPGDTAAVSREAVAAGGPATGADDAGRQRALQEMIASLDPSMKQTLSDALALYRRAPAPQTPAPRYLIGLRDAPVRITEFTDILCTHCAALEKTLDAIHENAPEGSYSVEPRQFPLDSGCNPLVERGGSPVRCLAAKVRICMEGRPEEPAVTRALFEHQEELTEEKVYALAAPYGKRSDLEACVGSVDTGTKLADDVHYASEFNPDGTPIVLVNGRLGSSFGPFLFAMILTRGETSNPAFDALPPPNPAAHLH